eukprot:scaffold273112_cov83-Cyclotella_meneghiniana.AAC.1
MNRRPSAAALTSLPPPAIPTLTGMLLLPQHLPCAILPAAIQSKTKLWNTQDPSLHQHISNSSRTAGATQKYSRLQLLLNDRVRLIMTAGRGKKTRLLSLQRRLVCCPDTSKLSMKLFQRLRHEAHGG